MQHCVCFFWVYCGYSWRQFVTSCSCLANSTTTMVTTPSGTQTRPTFNPSFLNSRLNLLFKGETNLRFENRWENAAKFTRHQLYISACHWVKPSWTWSIVLRERRASSPITPHETNSSPLKIGRRNPKGKYHLPTIHFQVQHVSFRECNWWKMWSWCWQGIQLWKGFWLGNVPKTLLEGRQTRILTLCPP